MPSKKVLGTIIIANGLFLFLDRFLKYQAVHVWSVPRLADKFFGWQPFFNRGIGFGLPLPNWLIIAVSIPVIILIGFLIFQTFRNHSIFNIQYPITLVFTGALSNFFDRLLYHHTIDYFFILTGYINLADVLIVGGFVLYLLHNFKIQNPNDKLNPKSKCQKLSC